MGKYEHQEHIREHWKKKNEEGFQCPTCGKLFTEWNQQAYFKHLETHVEENTDPCDCDVCTVPEAEPASAKRKRNAEAELSTASPKRKRSPEDEPEKNKKVATSTETDEGELEDGMSVQCGVCGESYTSTENLASHVASEHENGAQKEDPGSAGWNCSLCSGVFKSYRSLKLHRVRSQCVRKRDVAIEKPKVSDNPSAKEPLNNPGDKKKKITLPKTEELLSMMKAKFSVCMPGEEEEDELEEEERMEELLTAKNKKSLSLEPRVLSESSRAARKRLEYLTKVAQEMMRKKEQKRKKLGEKTKADEDEEEPFGLSTKDDLLIPLPNGWVCEKIRDGSAPSGYITNYWSPQGDRFSSLEEVSEHCTLHDIPIDLNMFKNYCIGDIKKPTDNKMTSVRVRDDETGLPLVIIFPEGQNAITMDVSATV